MTPEEKQQLQNLADRLNRLERSDRYRFEKTIELANGVNISFGGSVGSRIGTSASQKFGFFGATPVVRPGSIGAPTGGTTVDSQARTAISSILTALHNLGLIS